MNVPNAILTSQEDLIILSNVNKISLDRSISTITIEHSDGSKTVYKYGDVGIAQSDFNKWILSLSSANLGQNTAMADSSLTFVSITPSATNNSDANLYVMTGTGFLSSGINALKFDDGAGHVHIDYDDAIGIIDDTTIRCPNGLLVLPHAASYTVYYSINGGTNWITTGLTVTVS